MSRIYLEPKAKAALLRRLDSPEFQEVLRSAVMASMLWMTSDVARNRLLGQYLNRRTGTLIRSVEASPRIETVSDRGVTGAWGTHLGYGMAHEVGFHGTVAVREHIRRKFRYRSLRTGKRLKRRQAVEGASVRVRAHSREMNVRARHYIRDTVREGQEPTEARIVKALRLWFRTGRVPGFQQLRTA